MGENESLAVKAVVEANELLRDTIARHRKTIKALRAVNRKLREHQAIQHENDEEFKSVCAEDLRTWEDEGGFPAPVLSGE